MTDSDRTRLLSNPTVAAITNSSDIEIPPTRNYGSIPAENSHGDDAMDDSKTTLKFFEKIGFSLGHVYNDLCAAIWFSYTLLFMQGVLNMPGPQAGAMVMLGQVGDAIATPIVGILTDRFSTKRNWHIFGTFLVVATFPLIFAICPLCDIFPSWWKLTYFSIVILIFQFGWPVVQITHLAMIPELSRTQRDRTDLTATRYSASICSNVVVYMVTWAVLHIQTSYENKISPTDWPKFRVSACQYLFRHQTNIRFLFFSHTPGHCAHIDAHRSLHVSIIPLLSLTFELRSSTTLGEQSTALASIERHGIADKKRSGRRAVNIELRSRR